MGGDQSPENLYVDLGDKRVKANKKYRYGLRKTVSKETKLF